MEHTFSSVAQSCPTLCGPIDGNPSGSTIPGILQARTLEWVAISFSNAWKWKAKVKSLSCVWLFSTPGTVAYQAPPSMGFSRQEYWSELPLPSPKEGWVPKNWCFWTMVLEKTLESLLDGKEIKPVNPKGNQPSIFSGRNSCWSSDSLATWCEELTQWKRLWCWERLKAGGEVGDRR